MTTSNSALEKAPLTAEEIRKAIQIRGPREAAELLSTVDTTIAIQVLSGILSTQAQDILKHFSEDTRREILSAAPANLVKQWALEKQYPADSIGRLMEQPLGVFPPGMTVGEAIEQLRELVRGHLITYGFVTGPTNRLEGVITMRDLLFNEKSKPWLKSCSKTFLR